jgi:hypothetical protein
MEKEALEASSSNMHYSCHHFKDTQVLVLLLAGLGGGRGGGIPDVRRIWKIAGRSRFCA